MDFSFHKCVPALHKQRSKTLTTEAVKEGGRGGIEGERSCAEFPIRLTWLSLLNSPAPRSRLKPVIPLGRLLIPKEALLHPEIGIAAYPETALAATSNNLGYPASGHDPKSIHLAYLSAIIHKARNDKPEHDSAQEKTCRQYITGDHWAPEWGRMPAWSAEGAEAPR